jgi:glycogen synthase
MRARQPRSYRILMTADAVGGVWSYALRLAAALGDRAEVMLAVMGPPPTSGQRAAAQTIARMRLAIGDYPLEWMPGAGRDLAAAERWLMAQATDFAPDIIHVNGYAAANERWRRPVLVVAHSCVLSWWRSVHGAPTPPEWDGYAERVARGLTAAQRVVAPTHTMIEALRHHYGTPLDGARVIPNGCPAAPRRQGKEKIVFAAGRLWDEAKNLAALDCAAARVSWPVFVAGDCHHPDGSVVAPRCARALGVLNESALAAWMSRAAVFAAPARYEPFGLSVLEAAAAGCALILGDIPSLRELWDGAALFVPPDDHEALASMIDGVLTDDDWRDALGQAARRRSRRYGIESMAAGYLALYDEMTENAPARPQLAEVG